MRDTRPLHALPRLREVNLDQAAVGWEEGEALEAALRRGRRRVTVTVARKPLGDFRGPLDEASYAAVAGMLASEQILRGSGAFYVGESCIARPGDWFYAITRTEFDAAESLLTLWVNLYGDDVPVRLWAPRDVRVGAEEFRVGGASRVMFDDREMSADAPTAFRLG
ncbi:MAG: hypothetical protein U0325_07960 [Polyangiales bacterium]